MPDIERIAASLTKAQREIVKMSDPDVYRNFRHTAEAAFVDIDDVPAALRELATMGIMTFKRGLMTEDGEAYGSGYGLTEPYGLAVRTHLTKGGQDG